MSYCEMGAISELLLDGVVGVFGIRGERGGRLGERGAMIPSDSLRDLDCMRVIVKRDRKSETRGVLFKPTGDPGSPRSNDLHLLQEVSLFPNEGETY